MLHALFSDVHASERGLELLAHHEAFVEADHRVCLGDTLNAHEPDTVRQYFDKVKALADVIVMGNHEAVLAEICSTDVFNAKLHDQLNDAKNQLRVSDPGLIAELAALPRTVKLGPAQATHASFRPDSWKHVRYIEDLQVEAPFLPADVNILAHGHIPYIAWLDNGLWYYQRQIYGSTFQCAADRKYVINTGSILGSREMRGHERTFVTYDDTANTITFYNLED